MRPLDRSLYPFAPHHFDRGDGIRLHYVDVGPARPQGTVLMVHGNPSWSFYYRDLIRALSTTHRCLAPDHIGMGLSDKPSDARYPYTLDQRVADLERFVAAVAPEGPLTLVVHDWGGMIGLAWAVQHWQRINRLVLLNTAAFPLPAGKSLPWQLKLARTPVGTALVRGLNAFAVGATRSGVTRRPLPRPVRDGLLHPYGSWADRRAVLLFGQDIPLTPDSPGYATVTRTASQLECFRHTPTLIGWGGRDFVFDDAFLAEWRRRLPEATVVHLPQSGHYVLEDAADVLLPRIATFVRTA